MAYPNLDIIARKARDWEGNDWIVVDRGPAYDGHGRYVAATANARSLAAGEWFWGYYYNTLADAMRHFNEHERKDN